MNGFTSISITVAVKEALTRFCAIENYKQSDFVEDALDFFVSNGITPRDGLKEKEKHYQTLSSKMDKIGNRIIAFVKVQEEKFLKPSAVNLEILTDQISGQSIKKIQPEITVEPVQKAGTVDFESERKIAKLEKDLALVKTDIKILINNIHASIDNGSFKYRLDMDKGGYEPIAERYKWES